MNLLRNRDNNRSKGIAFVRFETEEGMKKALDTKNGSELMGRAIFLEVAG